MKTPSLGGSRLGQVLLAVVLSIVVGLMFGGLASSVVAWVGRNPTLESFSEGASQSLRRADELAIAQRDKAAAAVQDLDGVADVAGPGTGFREAYDTRVLTLTVTMSSRADAGQVAAVLEQARSASGSTHESKWLPYRTAVTTVITGNVQFTWTGGTETQAEALVALREDPEVSAATISMVRWTRPLWGSGSVTVAADADVQAVRERWEPQLRSIFAWVDDWEFARES